MTLNKRFTASLLALLMAFIGLCLPAHAVRTALTPVSPAALLNGAPAADSLDVAFTAADVANGNSVVLTGNELVFVINSHATTAYTFTVTSVKDELGRTGDITTYSLAAGKYALAGPFSTKGWQQTDGKLYLDASNAAIKFLVVKLRGTMQYK